MESKQTFDVDAFDRKVAQNIQEIHYTIRKKFENNKFMIWYNNHHEDLQVMYEMSGLSCDFETFCDYIFKNSELKMIC